jgi:protein-L-isoaspartate O-methyltransferase
VQVHAAVLASELRRRRVAARSVMSALDTVNRSTYILGDLREAPTSLLVLAALSLTSGVEEPRPGLSRT